MFYELLTINLLSFAFAIFILINTKKACYWNNFRRTDNEKMVLSAKQIKLLDWPSKMHSISFNRSQQREYWTYCLAIILKFFNKKDLSDFNNIILSVVANFFSPTIIYFIFKNYFNQEVGFYISLIYVTAFWSYYVSTYIGHILLSQLFFLLSILLIQLSNFNFENSFFSFLFIYLSGVFVTISYFSSSASRKYFFLVFIAFCLSKASLIKNFSDIKNFELEFISLIFFLILIQIFKNKIKFYFNQLSNSFIRLVVIILLYIASLSIFFNFSFNFYYNLFFFFLGIFTIIIHIFFPKEKFFFNLKKHITWLFVTDWASHIRAYEKKDQKKIFKRVLKDNFRGGGGIFWNHKIFLLFIPFLYLLNLFTFIFLVINYSLNNFDYGLFNLSLIFLVTILPVAIHEFTKGLKVAKAYFSFVITSLLIPALFIFEFKDNIQYLEILILLFIVIQCFHTLYILLSDTLPCRMAANNLYKFLKEKKITKFHTYNNPYNNSLVKALIANFPGEFEVIYIDSLDDVLSGTIVIPNCSSKSVNMESEIYSIKNGDFNKDKALNPLLKNKKIENIAIKKIKTMGSSKYFVNESEITSYRNLVLKQISNDDRWLGNAWVLFK